MEVAAAVEASTEAVEAVEASTAEAAFTEAVTTARIEAAGGGGLTAEAA